MYVVIMYHSMMIVPRRRDNNHSLSVDLQENRPVGSAGIEIAAKRDCGTPRQEAVIASYGVTCEKIIVVRENFAHLIHYTFFNTSVHSSVF
jgi:hypothetical protein